MMQKKTHIAFGLFMFAILMRYFHLNVTLAAFAGIGAILPDIDWFLDKKYVPKIVKRFTWNLVFPVGIHRTLLHNVWALGGTCTLFIYLSGSLSASIAFAIGFISHLVADSLTRSGIFWTWPFGDNRVFHQKRYLYFNGPVTTGTASEYTFQTLIYLISGALIAKQFNLI